MCSKSDFHGELEAWHPCETIATNVRTMRSRSNRIDRGAVSNNVLRELGRDRQRISCPGVIIDHASLPFTFLIVAALV